MGDVRSVEVREGLIRAESKVHWHATVGVLQNWWWREKEFGGDKGQGGLSWQGLLGFISG